MTQSQVADLIKVSRPEISNAENNIGYLQLEDIAILSNHFGRKIDLYESQTPLKKSEIIQNIIELCEHYPITVVAEFLGRIYRRENNPESFIAHYARQVTGDSVEPMLNSF